MAKEFQTQTGHDPATDALAQGLYEQAQAKGLTQYDEEPAAPDASDHDPRAQLDREIEAAQEPEPEPEEVEQQPEGEKPEQDGDPEEILSADAVIRLDDGREVTARELAEGSMRMADYTRKTQQLASERQQFETQTQTILGEYQQRSAQLDQLAQALQVELNQAHNPQELQRLKAEEPEQYLIKMGELQRRAQMIQAARNEQARIEQEQRSARVPYEREALKQKAKAFADDFDSTYKSVGEWALDPAGGGLTPEIWNGVYDHRFVHIAHKAMLWDKMQAQAASEAAPRIREHTQRRPSVVRPGVSQPAKSARDSAHEDYKRALADKEAMKTTDGIAAAFLAKEKLRSAGG